MLHVAFSNRASSAVVLLSYTQFKVFFCVCLVSSIQVASLPVTKMHEAIDGRAKRNDALSYNHAIQGKFSRGQQQLQIKATFSIFIGFYNDIYAWIIVVFNYLLLQI